MSKENNEYSYTHKSRKQIEPYEERLKFYESAPEGLKRMLDRPREGEYKELREEINEGIKTLGLNDLNELLYVIKEMQRGEYRYRYYRQSIID